MAGLSLVSVNIERSKHLDRVVPFLKARNADVVCVQELMEYDIPLFEKELGITSYFAPMDIMTEATLFAGEKPGVSGVGIFSRIPWVHASHKYYAGNPGDLAIFDDTSAATKHKTQKYVLVYIDLEKGDKLFRICGTHFSWTPRGESDDYQREDLRLLLAHLAKLGTLTLVGDFNAPRPGEIFTKIASHYKDNIPAHYKTSIDASLHRNGTIRPRDFDDKMVDGLFTTPEYIASDVALHAGVSDHMAVTATIMRS